MRNLIARLRRMGFLILVGVCLIIYIGLGIIYVQQGVKQKDLEKEITKVSIIVSKPMPSAEKLKAEYDEVNRSLAPLAAPVVLDIIVGIARESGIDVDPASGKFNISPPGNPATQKVGEGSYQVLALKRIQVQGDYDSVMAFISDLDSGKTLETMLLKGVNISQTELKVKAEEAARREEFRTVSLAVLALMTDNITDIPNPIDYAGGTAVNFLGDDPDTEGTVEGFPDITTAAVNRGYTGTGTPRGGYVLFEHDRISTDNTSDFETVSYINTRTTEYYYTSEADGTVRQFDGPDVATATEYPNSEWEEKRTEMYRVSSAVRDMMANNDLSTIPNPIDYASGTAVNFLGDDPDTEETVEGFPDIITTAADRGYTGTDILRDGYVLYKHDRISTDNTTLFGTVSYINMRTTKYYYTCEADGTVRQFDGPDVATATEYPNFETVAILDVDLYTKPLEGD